LKWTVFDALAKVVNPRVIWDVMLMWMDLDQKYVFGLNWLIFENLAFFSIVFIAFISFKGNKILNKHLIPPALAVALFFSSTSLRLLALTVAARLAINLEIH
jgi:hypothetical protein